MILPRRRARSRAAFASRRAGGSVDVVPRPRHRVTVVALLAVASLLVGAAPALAHSPTATRSVHLAPPLQASAPFAVQGSVEQVAVTGTAPGTAADLRDAKGRVVANGTTDAQGALLFREVTPGKGYTVTAAGASSSPVTVTSTTAVPPTLALHVAAALRRLRLPEDARRHDAVGEGHAAGPRRPGPYPTVVEYSGYDPSNPNGRAPASSIASLLGFATVGVNMRGTGCSGGSWDYFEPLQSLDGYDAIETVAAQPWVKGGKVGMVGISYPGITQLFVAATRPPHLAAITPLSVIDDTAATLMPGGIFNNGFALAVGAGAPGGRAAGGPEVGRQPHRRRRHDVRREPGAARSRSPDVLTSAKQIEYAGPQRRRAGARDLHRQDQRAGVHRRRVAGPGDRQSLRQHARRLLARRSR